MVTGFAHICILSNNLSVTEKFYVEILGMRKKFDFLRSGHRIGFYLEVGSGQFIEVFQKSDRDVSHSSALTHFCLQVNDIQATSHHLRKHHIDHQPPKLGTDQSWQIWFSDPDGIAIELHQYTSTSSQLTGKDCQVNW